MSASLPPLPGSAARVSEGTVARDYVDSDSGLRLLVMRGRFSWCAYVGAPCDSPLHGLEELQFSCHFDITFAQYGGEWPHPPGYFWWGWDYAHCTDRFFPPPGREHLFDGLPRRRGKDWTVDEVFEDAWDVLMTLRAALQRNDAMTRAILHKSLT